MGRRKIGIPVYITACIKFFGIIITFYFALLRIRIRNNLPRSVQIESELFEEKVDGQNRS